MKLPAYSFLKQVVEVREMLLLNANELRSALAVPPPEPVIIESVAAFLRRVARLESMCCPHCGGQFRSRRRCCRSAGQRPEDGVSIDCCQFLLRMARPFPDGLALWVGQGLSGGGTSTSQRVCAP